MRTFVSGCLITAAVTLVFYGAFAVVFLTLMLYPVLYLQDASSADAFRSASECASSAPSNDCWTVSASVITNVRSSDDPPEFDVQVNGHTVSVARHRGAYQPRDGDAVELKVWRGQPIVVTGPDGSQLITDQLPEARLKTDRDVLGVFVVVGLLSLVTAGLVGWFARGILFARFRGMTASNLIKGIALGLGLLVVIVPVTIVGQANGWLPQGRAGGTVVGLALVGVIVVAGFAYRLLRGSAPWRR